MKNTIKDLYNIDAKAIIKYSDKVYKIKNENDCDYCLKYIENVCNNALIDKINVLKLDESFQMPEKTCVRTRNAILNKKYFQVSKWVEDDLIESKDLKIKYYLTKLGELHKKSSYTLNVSSTYYNEIYMVLEEKIQQSYQFYEKIIFNIEKLDYISPFQWHIIDQFRYINESLLKSKDYLEEFKKNTKDKLIVRQVIGHLNFSYDHVFILQNKIIANDKIKQVPVVYDLKSLFDKIEFGSIDLSLLMNEYLAINSLEDYEIYWLFALLYIVEPLDFTQDEFINIKLLNNFSFKYKCINELESKIGKKNST